MVADKAWGNVFLFWCREILVGTEYCTKVLKKFTALALLQCTEAYGKQLYTVEFLALFTCIHIVEI